MAAPETIDGLQSTQQVQTLNIIDSLRSNGLHGVVQLPQLVVCGDQSSGKSSVLEAIAEIPFPRKENLCTRFATEIILRRTNTTSISCCIVPDKDRSQEEQDAITGHQLSLSDFDELPLLIDKVTTLVGLDDETKGKRAFAKDILRIEIAGPSRPQLTLVDLPGLIHSENKSQTKADIELVSSLVNTYLENKRTIILPVISAKNDYANQAVLTRARTVDPNGERTLGIITKPDELPCGSENEAAFIGLAKNEDIHFALGWHVLKNRGFGTMDHTLADRNASESMFFSKGKWRELPSHCLGIDALRGHLSELLFEHIKQELPSLRTELDDMYQDVIRSISALGKKRSTTTEQRGYLISMSTDFRDIAKAAVNGHYEDQYFGERSLSKSTRSTKRTRLCAEVQKYGSKWADAMRKNGHKHQINHAGKTANGKRKDVIKFGRKEVHIDQVDLTQSQALAWVKDIMNDSRGRELPGNFNPHLVGELFRVQSQNWDILASEHLDTITKLVSAFCHDLLSYLCPKDVADGYLATILDEALTKRADAAKAELEKLRSDRLSAPMTHNHYYTMTIQKIRKRKLRAAPAERGTKRHKTSSDDGPPATYPFGGFTNATNVTHPNVYGTFGRPSSGNITPQAPSGNVSSFDSAHINGFAGKHVPGGLPAPIPPLSDDDTDSDSDVADILLDMDDHSSGDALDSLMAYYKVARKTYIDNVTIQVIDRHIMRGLEDVFSPLEVASWDETQVASAAAESTKVLAQRRLLETRKERLEGGRKVFARVMA